MTSAQQTRTAWELFDKFSDTELDSLLSVAGVAPCESRDLKIHQALSVWFHGFIPNLEEISVILREKDLTK
jgi:hypothetical protein